MDSAIAALAPDITASAVNLRVSGVPTVLVDGVPLFSGAIRADLMEAELRKAAGHVRN